MLRIVRRLQDLRFSQLVEVYAESVCTLEQEQEFYQYLREGFFTRPGDVYCIWEAEGAYKAALRLQTYRDGILLEALETAPGERRRGYAKALVQAALEAFPNKKVYVHIDRRNRVSLGLHEACGFRKISDTAVFADGTATDRAGTFVLMRGI